MKVKAIARPYLNIFKSNDHWFYIFHWNFTVYRSNQGWSTRELATTEGNKHIDRVLERILDASNQKKN